MQKKWSFYSILLLLCFVFSFTACDNQSYSNAAKQGIINYAKSYNIKKYVVTEQITSDDLQVEDSFNFDNEYYVYMFYIGKLKNVPVYTSTSHGYGGQDYLCTLEFAKLDSVKFSNAVTHATESVRTVSDSLGAGISVTEKFGFEVGEETDIGVAKVSAKVSGEMSSTQSINYNKTTSLSETIKNSATTTNEYATTYSEGYKYEIDFKESAGFKRGREYRLAMYESVKIYAALIYDVNSEAENEKDKYSIEYLSFVDADKHIYLEESDEFGVFDDNDAVQSLSFDVDVAIDMIKDAKPSNVHSYAFVAGALTWEQAKVRAEEMGGHLVTVTSAEENEIIINILKKQSKSINVWLGATRKDDGKTWKWVTGEEFSYTNWRAGEPNNNNGSEFYLGIYEFGWNDFPTIISHGFIIEFE